MGKEKGAGLGGQERSGEVKVGRGTGKGGARGLRVKVRVRASVKG